MEDIIMDLRKFNTNYRYNSKYNVNKIGKIVRKLMEEDVNPHIFDFLFRFNIRQYPQASHIVLDLPGNLKTRKILPCLSQIMVCVRWIMPNQSLQTENG